MDSSSRNPEASLKTQPQGAATNGHERFRPVALPALAAAMRSVAQTAEAARAKAAARFAKRMVHEDEPAL
ncbi:hypothetical protein [Methylobacterium organophilum]|uniref:Uncharacterized protein n=1 Tax=Methylobacterium organophilum TaxID=410 RepID=A0ABQ4T6P3_METOR|nr:hypothetical protein [Methylobacterium organophilum]GJE26124.1 hypothetical protein LKMONMHP_0970 [Methylobacterium organophilum]